MKIIFTILFFVLFVRLSWVLGNDIVKGYEKSETRKALLHQPPYDK